MAIVVATLAAPRACPAQEAQASYPSHGYVGVADLSLPSYPGASSRRQYLLPVGEIWFSECGFASAIDGVGANVYRDEALRIAASVVPDLDERHQAAAGATAVDRAIRARLFARLVQGPFSLGASLAQDLSGHRGGLLGDIDVSLTRALQSDTDLKLGAGSAFGDGTYNRTWFGTPDAARSTPGAGIVTFRVHLGLVHRFDAHWFASVDIVEARLAGRVAASPAVEQARQPMTSVVLGRRF